MDVLTDLLERARARGAAFAHTTAYQDWGLRFPTGPGLAVHAIVEGEAYLWAGSGGVDAGLRLLPGDLVIVRGELVHHLAHRLGAACTPLEELVSAGAEPQGSRRFRIGTARESGGPAAVFFCGAYLFEGDLCDGLLKAIPEVVSIRPPAGSALRATLDLMAGELISENAGQQTLLDRLLDVALIQVLREHLAGQGDRAPAWFRATADPAVATALRVMHADPARPWTVADLAREANLSRAAFARRFATALGEAPLSYLLGWRMAIARELLRDTDDGLAAVAASVGYRSEFAFAAAFKRQHGIAPGRWRSRARPVRNGDATRPTPAPSLASPARA